MKYRGLGHCCPRPWVPRPGVTLPCLPTFPWGPRTGTGTGTDSRQSGQPAGRSTPRAGPGLVSPPPPHWCGDSHSSEQSALLSWDRLSDRTPPGHSDAGCYYSDGSCPLSSWRTRPDPGTRAFPGTALSGSRGAAGCGSAPRPSSQCLGPSLGPWPASSWGHFPRSTWQVGQRGDRARPLRARARELSCTGVTTHACRLCTFQEPERGAEAGDKAQRAPLRGCGRRQGPRIQHPWEPSRGRTLEALGCR